MNSVVSILCIALCAAVAVGGPLFPYSPPYARVRSYFYGGVPAAAPIVAPYASAVAPYAPGVAPVAAAPAVIPADYYSYTAANALSYPGYPYAGVYGYPYAGAYGYPYYKK